MATRMAVTCWRSDIPAASPASLRDVGSKLGSAATLVSDGLPPLLGSICLSSSPALRMARSRMRAAAATVTSGRTGKFALLGVVRMSTFVYIRPFVSPADAMHDTCAFHLLHARMRASNRDVSMIRREIPPTAETLCAEFDIEITGKSRYPEPGQTRAPGTIQRIINKRGAAHARLVLCVLAEGKGNNALIDEMSLWAVSDLVTACADIVEVDASALLELFDQIPIGPYMAIANELRGFVKQHSALAGMMYLHVRRLRPESMSCKDAAYIRNRRAEISEREKGRAASSRWRHRTTDEKLVLGRRLLEVKASMPHGHFGPWLREKADVSTNAARTAMRLARTV